MSDLDQARDAFEQDALALAASFERLCGAVLEHAPARDARTDAAFAERVVSLTFLMSALAQQLVAETAAHISTAEA